MSVDLDSLKWWGLLAHRIVTFATGLFTSAIVAIVHWEEFSEKISKLFGIRKYIERRIGERRHETMFDIKSLLDLPQDLAVLATIVPRLQAAIPLIQQNVADLNQAVADQKDPVALANDVSKLLTDLSADLKLIGDLLPKPTAAPAPAAGA